MRRVPGLRSLVPGLFVLVVALGAWSAGSRGGDEPPTLSELYQVRPGSDAGTVSFAEEKRGEAMRLAAVAFGAQAGLARRSWEIAAMLQGFERQLTRIYRFDQLVLRRSGFQVMPPVLGETKRAFRLARTRTRAASAERVLRIVEAERIVSAVPHWRDFVVRRWRLAEPPAAVLFPRDGEEQARWRGWLREGWALGRRQAEDVFASDLDRLNRTFEGIVAWHRLSEAAMVSEPVVLAERSGVSGGGRLMRIGEMVVHIADWAALNPRSEEWRVAYEGGAPLDVDVAVGGVDAGEGRGPDGAGGP